MRRLRQRLHNAEVINGAHNENTRVMDLIHFFDSHYTPQRFSRSPELCPPLQTETYFKTVGGGFGEKVGLKAAVSRPYRLE
jgi:hypothetical protein